MKIAHPRLMASARYRTRTVWSRGASGASDAGPHARSRSGSGRATARFSGGWESELGPNFVASTIEVAAPVVGQLIDNLQTEPAQAHWSVRELCLRVPPG